MGIHEGILERLRASLQAALIDNIPADDPARAGVVILGPLQGDPMDPDVARISIELYENDPDGFDEDPWSDEVEDEEYGGIEIGGALTQARRFTLKARCLLENTRETLSEARAIASTVRDRLERALLKTSFKDVTAEKEYVSRGVLSQNLKSRMLQNGGPDAYDFQILIKFEVLTTRTGIT